MKRILHVVSKMDRAGQETLIMNLYRNIDRSKIQFDFLCTNPENGDYDEEIVSLGGIIHILPPKKRRIKYIDYILSVFSTAKYLRSLNYDTIHLHNYHAFSSLIWVASAKLAAIGNIILHCHNTNAPRPFLHKVCRPLLRICCINRIACSTDASRWMFGKNESKIILNAIDTQKYEFNTKQREILRNELGLKDSTTAILHIGRFNYQKNHIFLLNVFNAYHLSHPDSKLLIVGKGELETDIKKYISSLGLSDSVKLLGVRSDIPTILSSCDLFLFPSLFEGLSVVLIEAQASGIPILTTTNMSVEAIFSNNVKQMELSQRIGDWADAIEPTIKLGRNISTSKMVADNGFDIKTVTKDLQHFYLGL